MSSIGIIRAGLCGIAAVVVTHAICRAAEVSATASPRIAFLAVEASPDQMPLHNRAAWQVARSGMNATLLLRQSNGTFADVNGKTRLLSEFDVAWYHQGNAIARNAMYRGPSLTALRQFAESGHGVLLSGGALALVAQLKLESEMRPQRHDLENWRDPAGMIPVEIRHPVFHGLAKTKDVIWLSRRGCRAVGDFYWGGPAEGMLLAKTQSGPQNPLVEYRLGTGRVIVFGWRWPDYADMDNPHRDNLLRLTTNLLSYLADSADWQPVVIRSDYPLAASGVFPEISGQEWRALRDAIEDLARTFPTLYPQAPRFLDRWAALKAEAKAIVSHAGKQQVAQLRQRFESLKRDALLTNPLLDFDRLLMIRRRADRLGLPLNFHGNPDVPPTGYDNVLMSLSPIRPDGRPQVIYCPEGDRFIGDLDLHYDANRLLFSTPDATGRWGVAELDLTTRTAKRLPLIDEPDVHNYDACYLPDERIVFTSTAPFIGVPCVGGRSKVANLYLRETNGRIRRLTHDQDHNWCPTVLNNGRLLYQRWEYADIAHAFTRLLFHSNPDGTGQMEYYGSNSFWPTAMFYARAIPNHPTRVVAVVGGHHDAPRQGELVILDPAKGRHETSGVVQRIPGHNQPVEPKILDGLIGNSWPRFLHPYPLSDKYFLVACKPTKTALWGIYLVDVFDNFVLLHEEPGWAMLEPIPWRKTRRPPVIPDRIHRDEKEATVLLSDVYRGPGLAGIPPGAVKALRLISYEFTFHNFGGEPDRVGFDGPWDVKRILGTVPVESDGSAHFRVPAMTPIGVQPLDAEGKAVALMRSWFTAEPGDVVSCVGCHEPQNSAPPVQKTPLALRRPPSSIEPWYGPARGFSFQREVQPVLDAYCVGCHNNAIEDTNQACFDLTARPAEQLPAAFQMHFTPSYVALRRFVHTPTLESDAHLLSPRDFHADTSKLIQILRDDHYGVRLSPEAWDRFITWIDLNAPAHGTWREVVGHIKTKAPYVTSGASRRRELNRRFAGLDEDPEIVYAAAKVVVSERIPNIAPAILQKKTPTKPSAVKRSAARRNTTPANPSVQTMSVPVADGVSLALTLIPRGEFMMGSDDGYSNERPARRVLIDKPFWMGQFEVTNRQFACFDPQHDSGLETGEQYQFGDDERGHVLNRPEQPVVRVSWNQAMAFCDWLSQTTGRQFTLPSEVQWEFACRAGSVTPLWYGTLDDDFSPFANLSDATHHTVSYPHVPTALPPWRPADTRFDDHWRVSAAVGSFRPNPWGLYDMHGNVSEWTRSAHRRSRATGEMKLDDVDRQVVRGGSWLDRPRRARSAFRLYFQPSQRIHNVGFRVVCSLKQ